jgi:hypothetical protein
MIPKNINHDHIIRAIQSTKKNNFPVREESTGYDLIFDGRRYPPKRIIRVANNYANGKELRGFHGGGETNNYLTRLGFVIVEKDKSPVESFFNNDELQYFLSLSGAQYYKNKPEHSVFLNLIKDSLKLKTLYWAEKAAPDGFLHSLRNHPLKRSYRSMTIRPYTWARIYKEKDLDKDIYFTVGIHVNKESEFPPGLVYKLDCQWQEFTHLSKDQIERFKTIMQEYPEAAWQSVPFDKVKIYTWEKLISETKNLFVNYKNLYEQVIKDVWDNKRIITNKKKLVNKKKEAKITSTENNKICRICWNTNGWIKPSGRLGKATTDSHEKRYGFGHEEWLFDTSRVLNGYQYGFLEPIRKFQTKYVGKKLNLLLFSRDSKSGQNFWIGQLNNVEVLNKDDARDIVRELKDKEIIKIMKEQLIEIGLDGNSLENEYLKESDIINVRFKKEEIQNIFENRILVEDDDIRVSSLYYVLLPWDGINNIEPVNDDDYFDTGNSGNGKLKSKAKNSYKAQTREIELTHNLISDSLLEYLKKKKGADKVKRECRVAGNNRIDIVVREKKGDTFYEIKTYPLLRTCLRYALGQLIEYSCYPENNKAKHFYLVSNIRADEKFERYIKHLNKCFNFNLGYIYYDLEKEEIIQTI